MSTKNKKRKHINPNRRKQERAEHRNNYLKRIKYYCSIIGGAGTYEMLPASELNFLYTARVLPFKIIPHAGDDIPANITKEIRALINYKLTHRVTQLVKNGPEITYYEYFTIAMSLIVYLKTLEDNAFKETAEFKEALKELYTDDAKTGALEVEISRWIEAYCMLFTDLTVKIYRFEQMYKSTPEKKTGIENLVIIYSHAPERISLKIDNINRPVIKVCHAYFKKDIIYLSIKPDVLGLNSEDYPDRISVCIQSHAAQRLKERIDSIHQMHAFLHLIFSFNKPEYYRNPDGMFFITYKLWGVKIGYLVADLHDDILLIRSFLFLTQDGTPEGNKLWSIFRLGKVDKAYLELDKLSTFITSDISSNPLLSELFTAADCKSLLEVYKVVQNNGNITERHINVDKLIQYMGLSSRQDFLSKELSPLKRFMSLMNVQNDY